jgi:hypothetical protein
MGASDERRETRDASVTTAFTKCFRILAWAFRLRPIGVQR